MSNLDSQFEVFMKEVSMHRSIRIIVVISSKIKEDFKVNNYDYFTHCACGLLGKLSSALFKAIVWRVC
jgi:hypothetical protein